MGFFIVLVFFFFSPLFVLYSLVGGGTGRREWELMRLWRESVKSEGSGVAICGHALAVPLLLAPPESKTRTGPAICTYSSVAAQFVVATETSLPFVRWY